MNREHDLRRTSPGSFHRVIVNADDLGYSPEVNDASFQQMSRRVVTSATIMANGPFAFQAMASALQFPEVSFGVHLNLSEFSPLTASPVLGEITGPDGRFAGDQIRRVRITRLLAEAVLQEWTAQVECVKRSGIRVSHFDSHHHVHTIPALFPVVKRLQARFRVGKVRLSMNGYPAKEKPPLHLLLKKAVWNFALRHVGSTVTTDAFVSPDGFVESLQMPRPRPMSIEVMTHPGARGWERELQRIEEAGRRADHWRVKLISYNQL